MVRLWSLELLRLSIHGICVILSIYCDRILLVNQFISQFALLRKESSELGFLQTLAKIRVEAVLDGIVSATIDLLGDVAPAITMH